MACCRNSTPVPIAPRGSLPGCYVSKRQQSVQTSRVLREEIKSVPSEEVAITCSNLPSDHCGAARVGYSVFYAADTYPEAFVLAVEPDAELEDNCTGYDRPILIGNGSYVKHCRTS